MRTVMNWEDFDQGHADLRRQGNWRSFVPTTVGADGFLQRNGRQLLNVASNDYLGLRCAFDQQWLNAATAQLAEVDECPMTGAGASRLVVGHDFFLEQLEARFAAFKGKDRVLFFASGYAANVGMLSSLISRGDTVFADKYIHASLYDGIHLSRAKLHRYEHLALDQLDSLLKNIPTGRGRRWIITDAVFSMDGTIAPMKELVDLAEQYGAQLIVDEAHAGGLFGTNGEGLVHELGLQKRVAVIMGTFSKAYGAYGAYVAADGPVIDQMIQQARSLIYSTGLPNVLWASVALQWERVRTERWRAKQVMDVAGHFAMKLLSNGISLGQWGTSIHGLSHATTPIVPVLVGSNEQSLNFSDRLRELGVSAIAIRPPTVPEGMARIRFSWSAAHTLEQAADVASKVKQVFDEMN